ncbi:hypothetical protein BBJ28_00004131, partial [Nothophytophthora sp. Chile5]
AEFASETAEPIAAVDECGAIAGSVAVVAAVSEMVDAVEAELEFAEEDFGEAAATESIPFAVDAVAEAEAEAEAEAGEVASAIDDAAEANVASEVEVSLAVEGGPAAAESENKSESESESEVAAVMSEVIAATAAAESEPVVADMVVANAVLVYCDGSLSLIGSMTAIDGVDAAIDNSVNVTSGEEVSAGLDSDLTAFEMEVVAVTVAAKTEPDAVDVESITADAEVVAVEPNVSEPLTGATETIATNESAVHAASTTVENAADVSSEVEVASAEDGDSNAVLSEVTAVILQVVAAVGGVAAVEYAEAAVETEDVAPPEVEAAMEENASVTADDNNESVPREASAPHTAKNVATDVLTAMESEVVVGESALVGGETKLDAAEMSGSILAECNEGAESGTSSFGESSAAAIVAAVMGALLKTVDVVEADAEGSEVVGTDGETNEVTPGVDTAEEEIDTLAVAEDEAVSVSEMEAAVDAISPLTTANEIQPSDLAALASGEVEVVEAAWRATTKKATPAQVSAAAIASAVVGALLEVVDAVEAEGEDATDSGEDATADSLRAATESLVRLDSTVVKAEAVWSNDDDASLPTRLDCDPVAKPSAVASSEVVRQAEVVDAAALVDTNPSAQLMNVAASSTATAGALLEMVDTIADE